MEGKSRKKFQLLAELNLNEAAPKEKSKEIIQLPLLNDLKSHSIESTTSQVNRANYPIAHQARLSQANILSSLPPLPPHSVQKSPQNVNSTPSHKESKHHLAPTKDFKENKFQQKDIKLRDFQCFEKISQLDLESIELPYIKKLYMLQPNNTECLLYRLQKKQNSNFDGTSYTDTMQEIFQDCYQLPLLMRRYDSEGKVKNSTDEPYDELFIWSLLLYSGDDKDVKLCYHFLSKAKHPIACCLAGIFLFKTLKRENFVPDDLKERLSYMALEFEKISMSILAKCNDTNQLIAQDLLICEIDIFYKHSVLELAIKARTHDFVCLSPFQQLLTDVWFGTINPHASNWQIFFPYLFFPFLFLPISYFRSDIVDLINFTELDEKSSRMSIKHSVNAVSPIDERVHRQRLIKSKSKDKTDIEFFDLTQVPNVPNEELNYRTTKYKLKGFNRVYAYYNAPIVKFLNHFICYLMFLLLFSGFLLFDYYPDKEMPTTAIRIPVGSDPAMIKVTVTELIVIICVFIFQLGQIRQFLETRAPDSSIVTKIKKFFTENKWNMFDVLIFLTFYLTLSIRFSPIYGKVYYIASETCYESARVLYCINSILWYIRILPMISCVPFWGPKIIIIQEMLKKLLVFVVLILVFLLPFAASFETVVNKTQNISIGVITHAINRSFWVMFGELLDVLNEFADFQCGFQPDDGQQKACHHSMSSLFLYIGFAFYTITINLLLLNMIIATFSATVENIDVDSKKIFKFQRFQGIKECSEKTILPAPFVIIEYTFFTIKFIRNYMNGTEIIKKNDFHIQEMEDETKEFYIKFETHHRDQHFNQDEKNEEKPEQSKEPRHVEEIMKSLNHFEENLNMFKIWVLDQQNEKFNQLKSVIESLSNRIDSKISRQQQ